MHKGDILLSYTDGVTEAMNADKNLFSENRLKRFLQNGNGQVTVEKLVKALVGDVWHCSALPRAWQILPA